VGGFPHMQLVKKKSKTPKKKNLFILKKKRIKKKSFYSLNRGKRGFFYVLSKEVEKFHVSRNGDVAEGKKEEY
jgi:hypothetical protein